MPNIPPTPPPARRSKRTPPLPRKGFFSLPLELREIAYSYLFPPYATYQTGQLDEETRYRLPACGVDTTTPSSSVHLAPLLACRQFYFETRQLAWKTAYFATFRGTDDIEARLARLKERVAALGEKRAWIRSLEIGPLLACGHPEYENVVRKELNLAEMGLLNLEQLVIRVFCMGWGLSEPLLTWVGQIVQHDMRCEKICIIPDGFFKIHECIEEMRDLKTFVDHTDCGYEGDVDLEVGDWKDLHTFSILACVGDGERKRTIKVYLCGGIMGRGTIYAPTVEQCQVEDGSCKCHVERRRQELNRMVEA